MVMPALWRPGGQYVRDDVMHELSGDGPVGDEAAVEERAGEEVGDDLQVQVAGELTALAGTGQDGKQRFTSAAGRRGNGVWSSRVTKAVSRCATSVCTLPVSGTGNGWNVASIASMRSAPTVGQRRYTVALLAPARRARPPW